MVMVLYGNTMLGTTVRKGPNLICLHGIYVFFLVYMLHIPFILLFNYVCLYYSCRFSCPMAWLMNKYVHRSTRPASFFKQCDSFTAHSWYVISGHRDI